jgi:hypothetical protein
MRRAVAGTFAWLFVMATVEARAEPVAVPRPAPTEHVTVGATFVTSVWASASSVRAFHESTQLDARVAWGKRAEVGAAFAVSYTTFSSDTEPSRSATRASNPVLWGSLRAYDADGASAHVGALIGAPLVLTPSGVPENVTARFGDRMARAARGYDTPWLFADAAIPVALTLSGTARPSSLLEVGATVQPGALVSVSRKSSRLAVVGSTYLALVFGPGRVGVRGTVGAESVPIEGHDFAQVSLSPFVGWEGERFYVSASTTLGLAGPYRIGSEISTAWGTAVSFGFKL